MTVKVVLLAAISDRKITGAESDFEEVKYNLAHV
jgi:hypothetical protein